MTRVVIPPDSTVSVDGGSSAFSPLTFENDPSGEWFVDRLKVSCLTVADPENFGGGGGFEAQNLKISDVFIRIESDSSAEI